MLFRSDLLGLSVDALLGVAQVKYRRIRVHDVPDSGLRERDADGIDAKKAMRHLATIQRSWSPKHEHKEAAVAFLEQVRAANRTARHNVYAYVLQNGRTRYSDDGEPAKTAGTPVLETIGHAGVADVIVVVTRYFGGILLGTGGLVRAYTAAASGALQSAELVSMRLVVDCKVRVSYAQFEQAQRIIAAAETRLDEPIFDDAVTLCWRMPAGREETLRTALNELTRGGAEVEISAPQYAAF